MVPMNLLKRVIALGGVLSLVATDKICCGSAAPLVIHFGQLVDNESSSADCLSCHDAMIAREAGFQRVSHTSSANPLGSHPIEVSYPQDWMGNGSFVPGSEIGNRGCVCWTTG